MVRYALITGGSRGLGRAISVKLAQMGIPVVINYQSNADAANETKTMVEAAGGTAELLPFNVSDKDAIDAALTQWEETHPDAYIAYLVNNAGIRRDGMLFMMSDEDWHSVLNTTLNGFFYITRRLVGTMMRRRHGGSIVNVASLSGLQGMQGQTNYSAAKAGLIGATKSLALEVAARDVRVNAIAPGFIETDMTKDLDRESLEKMVPMKRFGRPEEVANLVGFLISDASSYITGEVISINGGLYT